MILFYPHMEQNIHILQLDLKKDYVDVYELKVDYNQVQKWEVRRQLQI